MNFRESLTRFGYFCCGLWTDTWYYTKGITFLVKRCEIPKLFSKPLVFDDIPSRDGDVAVITGGAAGIGYDIIKKLLNADFHVILGVRNMDRGKQTADKLREDGITTRRLEYLELELSSLNSVRRFSKLVLSRTSKIHILINNAGIMMMPYTVTEDNMESHFQVNYLSHFLLTNLLLPTIIRTGEDSGKACRIVNVSSAAAMIGNINFDDLQFSKVYSRFKAYFDSKLAQILNTKYLDRSMVEATNNVRVYAVHPGMIPTDLWNQSLTLHIRRRVFPNSLETVESGGDRVIYAALSPNLENTGGVFLWDNEDCHDNIQAEDVAAQENLWHLSLDLAGLKLNHNYNF